MIEEDLKEMRRNLESEAAQHGIYYVSISVHANDYSSTALVHVGKIGGGGVLQVQADTIREAFDEAVRRALWDRYLRESAA